METNKQGSKRSAAPESAESSGPKKQFLDEENNKKKLDEVLDKFIYNSLNLKNSDGIGFFDTPDHLGNDIEPTAIHKRESMQHGFVAPMSNSLDSILLNLRNVFPSDGTRVEFLDKNTREKREKLRKVFDEKASYFLSKKESSGVNMLPSSYNVFDVYLLSKLLKNSISSNSINSSAINPNLIDAFALANSVFECANNSLSLMDYMLKENNKLKVEIDELKLDNELLKAKVQLKAAGFSPTGDVMASSEQHNAIKKLAKQKPKTKSSSKTQRSYQRSSFGKSSMILKQIPTKVQDNVVSDGKLSINRIPKVLGRTTNQYMDSEIARQGSSKDRHNHHGVGSFGSAMIQNFTMTDLSLLGVSIADNSNTAQGTSGTTNFTAKVPTEDSRVSKISTDMDKYLKPSSSANHQHLGGSSSKGTEVNPENTARRPSIIRVSSITSDGESVNCEFSDEDFMHIFSVSNSIDISNKLSDHDIIATLDALEASLDYNEPQSTKKELNVYAAPPQGAQDRSTEQKDKQGRSR